MKKHIFFVGGGGGGGGGGGRADNECTVSPGDVHHFGFYKKKKSEEDWTKQVVR